MRDLTGYIIQRADELGYALQYEICPRCGNPLISPVGGFARVEGGILCRNCHGSERGTMAEAVWEALVSVAAAPEPPDYHIPAGVQNALSGLLLDYLGYHADKPLRLESLRLLTDSGDA